MKLLIVVDMQNDFIDGCLGSPEAVGIVHAVEEKITAYRQTGDMVIFTRDTHGESYLHTQEGQKLPIPHCIKDTHGWQISRCLSVGDSVIVDKPAFGSLELARYVAALPDITAIELVGLCTDICVISNAMVLKAALPELPISVDGSCCAGVNPSSHETALKAMSACQIQVL